MKYWLMKTEPNTYSWDDLKKETNKTTCWDGVRNYQARNMLRDEIKKGDMVFFYHSVVNPPAIVGIASVEKGGYPDHTAFDKEHHYYDPKSNPDDPVWYMVDIKAVQEFDVPVSLTELKTHPSLQQMKLLQKGSRLSVQPVRPMEWQYICNMRRIKPV